MNTTAPVVVDTAKVVTDKIEKVETPIQETKPSCDLNWILFDFDKFDIKSDANGELTLMAKILKENPTYKGVLKAFTDSKGNDDYNQRLSANRAQAAKRCTCIKRNRSRKDNNWGI
ncbi:MAG: OmpA family protein [Saprospiraceae bacterium]|nr:OmpA family protein [Saprospiraceae bacterium]